MMLESGMPRRLTVRYLCGSVSWVCGFWDGFVHPEGVCHVLEGCYLEGDGEVEEKCLPCS